MFNSAGTGGSLFGSQQGQTMFGQSQNSQSAFFGSSNINGTTVKYVPFGGSDTVQKNSQNITVQTKLNCISAMKEYEAKSLEELRFEDYSSNRITAPKSSTTGMFGGNQTTPGLFNQTSMFQNNSPFGSTQQSALGNTTPNTLFGASNQTNAFGNKSLFGANPTSTSSAFNSFTNPAKTNSIFGMNASTNNSPLFGATQPTQSSNLFGKNPQTPAPLFGSQQPQATGLFGGLSSQQNQQTGIFNNTSTSSFGFQSQASTGLFGTNNAAKPFGQANTNFSFSNSGASTNSSLFTNTTPVSGLFANNTSNAVFGGAQKPALFSNTSTFSTPASSQTQSIFPQQSTGVFGQSNLFQNQQKPNQFGAASAFNNTPKSNLFGNNTNAGFGQSNLFGGFSSPSQPFGSTITTSTIAPINNTYQMGITTPAEAAFQQQVMQQRILSLVSNRPYGVNKLFMGQNMSKGESKVSMTENNTSNHNLSSLVIKRNDADAISSNQRRRILNQKTKVIPNHLYKVFSGFDEDEDQSTKSNNVDSYFFRKREDWKYLPPSAFEKSRKSLNNNNSPLNSNFREKESNLDDIEPSSFVNQLKADINQNQCSTPMSDKSYRRTPINQTSVSHNGRASPLQYPILKKRECLSNNNNESLSMKQIDVKDVLSSKGNSIKKSNSSSFNKLQLSVENNSYNDNINSDNDNVCNNEEIDNDDDESINNDGVKCCMIKLTNEGYYTAPDFEILDKLVCVNELGEKECWVENFIIGRNDYGSIRFPGFTNIYAMDLDQMVNIQWKEVSVYPDDENKPDEGEGLNKLAQVSLKKVWPIDKSSGELIKDETRLKMMNFEERLRRSTERLGARFVSYNSSDGSWGFEVDHFSKYTFLDSDEDEQLPVQQKIVTKKSADSSQYLLKKETKIKTLDNEHATLLVDNNVVSAEADSMTHGFNSSVRTNVTKSLFDKLLDPTISHNVNKMKQSIRNYDSDEEYSDAMFGAVSKNNNYSFTFDKGQQRDGDQPKPKKFETSDMGERMFASLNNSKMDYTESCSAQFNGNLVKITQEKFDKRPIKPLNSEHLASTIPVQSCSQVDNYLSIPSHMRDLRSLKMPYLFLKFVKYFDVITPDMHKRYSPNVALTQGNRFRVGFQMSNDKISPGLKFFKINSTDDRVSSFNSLYKKDIANSLMIMKCNSKLSNYQETLMKACLSVSRCNIDNNTQCPLWGSPAGLDVLNCYITAHDQMKNVSSTEKSGFERIVRLCNALWNDLGNNQELLPPFINDLGRKQVLSKWIKLSCREELMTEVEQLMLTTVSINMNNCNRLILRALCSGEINLACKLAMATKQHRLSLLIAQSASDMQGREIIREQLNLWLQSMTDEHISPHILSIYLILSGQTSMTMSDGSILAPFKQMNWMQAFGSQLWFAQSYLASVNSALELYDDILNTDTDIPPPYPIDYSGTLCNEDDYQYYDCCYHLIKLYCDRLYDLDVVLNPPTVSMDTRHKLSWDWSSSWHLANILTSLGFSKQIPIKISLEWAAQLERGGMWQMAIFVLLHVPQQLDNDHHSSLLKNLINRHVIESKQLTDEELFLVDKLSIPSSWIHEAKAIYCKTAVRNKELEAYHWLKAGQLDKSHQLYINEIVPQLLINDQFDAIKSMLFQFTDGNNDSTNIASSLSDWCVGGHVYLSYINIVCNQRTLRLTNRLANHSFLMSNDNDDIIHMDDCIDDPFTNNDLNIQLAKLSNDCSNLLKLMNGFRIVNDAQRICRNQIVTMCDQSLMACRTDMLS